MKNSILKALLCSILLLPVLANAKGIDLYDLFPNLILGFDPGPPDYVYISCVSQSATQMTMAVRIVTDNGGDPADAIAGVEIELLATADQLGVCLDTTILTTYQGSAASDWGAGFIYLPCNGGDPCIFPLCIKLGGVDLDTFDVGGPLGPGDHLFATLRFNISSPTNINVSGTTLQNGPATLATTMANGYEVPVVPETCGPIVPTLSEWGLILFGLALMAGIVFFLRRRRSIA